MEHQVRKNSLQLMSLKRRLQLSSLVILSFMVLPLVGCQSCRQPETKENQRESAVLNKPPTDIPLTDIANESNDPHNLSDGEPSITVNPRDPKDIVILAFSGEWGGNASTGPIFAPIWRSHDGGSSWHKLEQIPPPPPLFPLGPRGPALLLAGPTDQHAMFDQSGKLVVVAMGSYQNSTAENFIFAESGSGTSGLTLQREFGNANSDQPHVATSMGSGKCAETIYSAWLRVDLQQAMDSTAVAGVNGGADVTVGETEFPNRTARIAVSKDGRAYLVYKSIEGQPGPESHKAHFLVKASDDCGKTWEALQGKRGVSVNGVEAVDTIFADDFGHLLNKSLQVQARAKSSDAWITTDTETGEVYVVYVAKNGKGIMQIWLAHSIDRGRTWSDTEVTHSEYNSAYPEIAVATNGTLGVMYVDAEENSHSTVFRHRFARSFDHGKGWVTDTLQAMDPSQLQEIIDKPFDNSNQILWGDYEGLTARGLVFYGVFTGASIGRKRSQLDPIFFTVSASDAKIEPR